MANGVIDSNLIVLYDLWPGVASVVGELPTDGIANTTDNNVAAATRRYGEKVTVYNATAGVAGYATFVYLQMGTQDATAAAVKSACVNDSASLWYQLTNDMDSCIAISGGLMAYAIGTVTDAYWGFFWCAGVVPEDFVSTIGGNFVTDGTLTPGGFCAATATTVVGIGVLDAATDVPCGYSLLIDT